MMKNKQPHAINHKSRGDIAVGFYNMEAWRKCEDTALRLEGFIGRRCHQGVERSSRLDLASRVKVFREGEAGAVHYFIFGRHYVPEDLAMDGEHAHYERWIASGNLVAVPRPEIQLEMIQREIEAEIPKYEMCCIAFDLWSGLQMQRDLAKKLPYDTVISIPQTVQYLSPAMKEVEAAILSGRLHHDGDPVLTWAISNVIAREDSNENVFPRKKKSEQNIDAHSALLNAISGAMFGPGHMQG